MKNDLKILVLSCANFSDLWSNNIHLLNLYWPKHPEFLMTSDGLGKYDLSQFNELSVIDDANMTNRFICGLEKIKSKYVLVTLDDYFLKDRVDDEKIDLIINYMDENDISYCRLFPKKKTKGDINKKLKLRKLPLSSVYEVNLYPGIWKRESLLKILHPNEDIWKAEVRMTKRCRESNLKCIYSLDKKIFNFEDIVRKGKYLRPAYKFLKKNNLFISDRKIRTRKETFKLGMQTFVSDHAPKFIKNLIKKHLRKKNVKFYSDYENDD